MDNTWNTFCDKLDAHRRELALIQRRMAKDNAKVAEAIRAYYAQHRAQACKPGTEFVVNADRTLEVKP